MVCPDFFETDVTTGIQDEKSDENQNMAVFKEASFYAFKKTLSLEQFKLIKLKLIL